MDWRQNTYDTSSGLQGRFAFPPPAPLFPLMGVLLSPDNSLPTFATAWMQAWERIELERIPSFKKKKN